MTYNVLSGMLNPTQSIKTRKKDRKTVVMRWVVSTPFGTLAIW